MISFLWLFGRRVIQQSDMRSSNQVTQKTIGSMRSRYEWLKLSRWKKQLYGCFLKWWYPQIIHFNRLFHYKPSILGYPYFSKPPYLVSPFLISTVISFGWSLNMIWRWMIAPLPSNSMNMCMNICNTHINASKFIQFMQCLGDQSINTTTWRSTTICIYIYIYHI